MKPSYITVALLAIILPLAGFVVGTLVSPGAPLMPLSQQEEQTAEEPRQPPESLSMPGEDVPGEDLQDLSRYPDSVRIEYIREKQGDVVWTEIEYLTDANLEQTREFYRDSFRSEGWEVNDIGFAQSSWIFFVVKDSREVFVEIRPRGGIVEVDIEQTKPLFEQTTEPAADSGNRQQDENAPREASPQQEAVSQQVVPEDDDYDDDLGDDDGYEDELDDDDYEGYDD